MGRGVEEIKMPKRPKRPCSYPGCPHLTEGRYCEEHEKIMNDRYNRYERPYNSSVRYGKSWRKIRNTYLSLHPFCESCLKQGKYIKATEVHHILPLQHGGTHDLENLMSLCKPCHSRITAEMGDRWHNKK
jgi:5-methylcytosine-specific restriction protein A